MGRRYRVGERTRLTGVSVRTLHLDDQIGLPLREIARLLRRPDFDLIASPRIQEGGHAGTWNGADQAGPPRSYPGSHLSAQHN